jgi:antitoxin Phd
MPASRRTRDTRWSLQDAKNRFSTVVDAALEGRPQTVTRHGKPAVVVVSARDFERLQKRNAPGAPSFVDHLLAIPQDDGTFDRAAATPRDVEF